MTVHERKLKRIRRLEKAVKRLQRMHLFYKWGGARFGARITSPQRKFEDWTDCSGFIFWCLAILGVHWPDSIIMSTVGLETLGVEGESDYFTIYVKSDHTIARLRKRPRPWHRGQPHYRYIECGGSDNPTSGDGPCYFIPGRKMGISWQARLAEFPVRRCFPGL